jgi:hypothetical protein
MSLTRFQDRPSQCGNTKDDSWNIMEKLDLNALRIELNIITAVLEKVVSIYSTCRRLDWEA